VTSIAYAIKDYPINRQGIVKNLISKWNDLISNRDPSQSVSEKEEEGFSSVQRSDSYPKANRFYTIIDSVEKGLTPEKFRKMFNGSDFATRAVACNAETVGGDQIFSESGDLHTHYIVVDVNIPFVSPRICGNTLYTLWNYRGKEDEHLVLYSTYGNEKFMTREYLGGSVMDGKVIASNDMSGYYIRPAEGGGYKVTYMIIADTNGTPDFLFRNFGTKNMFAGFRDAMDYAKNL
jgi:hypothetical protein